MGTFQTNWEFLGSFVFVKNVGIFEMETCDFLILDENIFWRST